MNEQKQWEECIQRLEGTGDLDLRIDPFTAVIVIGQLQMALRHPGNRGPSAIVAAQVVASLIDRLADKVPDIRTLLEQGNDPRFDTPVPAMEGRAVVRPQKVTLCGSTKFRREYEAVMRTETLCGRIVLTVGMFGHVEGIDMDGPVKKMLDELHLRKIDESDAIFVLNAPGPDGRPYIGDSTRREIYYARAHGKRVRWLNLPCEEAVEGEGS